jgi:hypothetical protein
MVKRQQERDVARLLPTIRHLTERQYQLFFLIHRVITRHQPDGPVRLADQDVAQAAGSLASTLETAARGVIYEHPVGGGPARRLLEEISALLRTMREQGHVVYDGEAAIVLRAVEKGAAELGGKDATTDYLDLMVRLMDVRPTAPSPGALESAPRVIIP